MAQISNDIRRSIQYGLDHREEAIDYAIQFSRGLDLQKADRFIGMYVNELTLDYGEEGRKAVRLLLAEAHKQKIIPKKRRSGIRLAVGREDATRNDLEEASRLFHEAYRKQMSQELEEAVELYKKSIEAIRLPRRTHFWAGPTVSWAASTTRSPNATRRLRRSRLRKSVQRHRRVPHAEGQGR